MSAAPIVPCCNAKPAVTNALATALGTSLNGRLHAGGLTERRLYVRPTAASPRYTWSSASCRSKIKQVAGAKLGLKARQWQSTCTLLQLMVRLVQSKLHRGRRQLQLSGRNIH